jgi:DNA-binding ferritin-like protein
MEHLQLVLEETFSANFIAYYRSHVAHVNTVGRHFYSDHKLLQKVYEYFQDNIDTIAEKLRTVRGTMPDSLTSIIAISRIADTPVYGDSDELLRLVDESLESMIDQYHELNDAAEAVRYIDISNFAQDQIGQIAKLRWMIEATLDERVEE